VKQPLILLSNDDGYHSEGIHVLSDALESPRRGLGGRAGSRELRRVARADALAALRLTQLAERGFAVDGTPTDCVTLGVGQVLKGRAPDLVVSGINFGANMGDDVHYSGTVSAAFEAVILGVPAIAISQVIWHEFSFAFAGRFARLIASRVLARGLPPVRCSTSTCHPTRRRVYGSRGSASGPTPRASWRTPTRAAESATGSAAATRCGRTSQAPTSRRWAPAYISVSPLQLDMTDRDQLVRLESEAAAWDLEGS